jgi:cytosine/adenosine deaminase-related metal-dependent hydrolase
MILRARQTLMGSASGGAHWIDGGGVQIENGRIARVLEGPGALARAISSSGTTAHDLGEGLLLPGFVNAHAHLELSGMRLPSAPFAQWIGSILKARREFEPGDYARGVEAGEARLLETGCTCVGDISSTASAALAARRLRSVVYREVLDAWDTGRTSQSMLSVEEPLPAGGLRSEGISPHAPYTTSSQLLAAVARSIQKRPMPVAIHWAESRAEMEWLASGEGDFAPFFPPSPRISGLDLLEQAGLLGPGTSLIHGNLPAPQDPARLAQAGVVLVHCPGTHLFFKRPEFTWRSYAKAGVPIALGSDSRASNADLDMRREMALARAGNAALSPLAVFAMATQVGANALGLGADVGSIEPGKAADLAFHAGLGLDPQQALEELTSGGGRVQALYIAGRSILSN